MSEPRRFPVTLAGPDESAWRELEADGGARHFAFARAATREQALAGPRAAVALVELTAGPKWDGFGLARRLRERGTPVVLVSSRPRELKDDEVLALGAEAFFPRPLDTASLTLTLLRLAVAAEPERSGASPGAAANPG